MALGGRLYCLRKRYLLMKFDLIGVPLYYGCDNPGTEGAYDTFLTQGLLPRLAEEAGHSVERACCLDVPTAGGPGERFDLPYYSPILETCRQLEDQVSQSLFRGHFPLVIGGDHSLGIGSVAGANRAFDREDYSVVWVDAHTDINTQATSPSHHIHGMPLAACLGLGDPLLFDGFGRQTPMLLPKNLFYIGARSIDPGEAQILQEHGITVIGMGDIRSLGMEGACRKLLSLIRTPHIHLSFDVDFMDAAEYTATGLPVPHGPSIQDTHTCLSCLLQSGKVRSMDFVEYSPRHDSPDRKGLATCAGLLSTCFAALAQTEHR